MLIERGWLRPLYVTNIPLKMMIGRSKRSPLFAVSPVALQNEPETSVQARYQPVPTVPSLSTDTTDSDRNMTGNHSPLDRLVPMVQSAKANIRVLSPLNSPFTEDPPESGTNGTIMTEVTSTEPVEADDLSDPFDLI